MSTLTIRSLVATDRCDRCNARAQVSLKMPVSEAELMFCGHHFTEHAAKLTMDGALLTGQWDGES